MNRRRFLKAGLLWVPFAPAILRGQAWTWRDPAFMGATKPNIGCTTPTNGTLNEGFQGSPYEITSPAWIAVTSGGLDTAYAVPGTGPSGSCTKCMRVVPAGASTYIKNDWGANKAGIGVRCYIYISAQGANGSANDLFGIYQANLNSSVFFATVRVASGVLKIDFSGTTTSTGWAISLATWYQLDFHGAPSSATIAGKINGANEQTVTGQNRTMRYSSFGAGPNNASTGWDWAMDIIQWSYSDAYIV